MSVETILIWMAIGLVAGWLASRVVGRGGYGVIGDIVLGIVGAFLGGLMFRTLHLQNAVHGRGVHDLRRLRRRRRPVAAHAPGQSALLARRVTADITAAPWGRQTRKGYQCDISGSA